MTVPANSNWPIIFYALKMLIPKLPRVVAQINANNAAMNQQRILNILDTLELQLQQLDKQLVQMTQQLGQGQINQLGRMDNLLEARKPILIANAASSAEALLFYPLGIPADVLAQLPVTKLDAFAITGQRAFELLELLGVPVDVNESAAEQRARFFRWIGIEGVRRV